MSSAPSQYQPQPAPSSSSSAPSSTPVVISVPNSVVGAIIGRGGESIKNIQGVTGCQVKVERVSILLERLRRSPLLTPSLVPSFLPLSPHLTPPMPPPHTNLHPSSKESEMAPGSTTRQITFIGADEQGESVLERSVNAVHEQRRYCTKKIVWTRFACRSTRLYTISALPTPLPFLTR